jgi:hypothetical protein
MIEQITRHLPCIRSVRSKTTRLFLSRDSRQQFTRFEFEQFKHLRTFLLTWDSQKQRDQEGYCSRMPRSLPVAIPQKTGGKSKGNRSVRCIPGGNEAIWDEELHTALIEGIWFDRQLHND